MHRVVKLTLRVRDVVQKEGILVRKDHELMFMTIMYGNECQFEEDSLQWLLWQQQKEQASKPNACGMRCHSLIIRWCLSLITSPAVYIFSDFRYISNILSLKYIQTGWFYMN